MRLVHWNRFGTNRLLFLIVMISVLFNTREGFSVTFDPAVTPGVSTPYKQFLVIDVNNDGKPDLIGQPTQTTLGIYLQGAGGSFSSSQTPATKDYVYGMGYGDVNNDGYLDMLTAGPNGVTTSPNYVFINNAGTFAAGVTFYTSHNVAFYGQNVTSGQLNPDVDSIPDAAFLGTGELLLGWGAYNPGASPAQFSTFRNDAISAPDGTPGKIVIADADGDGKQDIFIAHTVNSDGAVGAIQIRVNDGAGNFTDTIIDSNSASWDALTAVNFSPISIGVGDFNADGKNDIVFHNANSTFLKLAVGLRTSANGSAPTYTFSTIDLAIYSSTYSFTGVHAIADIDADGKTDLVVGGNDGTKVLLGNNDGTFTLGTALSGREPKLADVNSDGKLDVVLTSGGVKIYYQSGATVPALTITANSLTKVYGDELTLESATFSITSGELQNSDTITGVTLTSAGAEIDASAGTYAITPSNAVGQGIENYSLTYAAGTLTVLKALPTVSTWPEASAITLGEALSSSTLTGGTASVTGTFSFDLSTTIPDAGINAQGVTFTPADPINYHPVTGTVTVTVNYPPQTLSVGKSGTGQGSIISSPTGINCGSSCSFNFAYGTEITLWAIPDSGSTFTGWSGDSAGNSNTVRLTMNSDQSVSAVFTVQPAFEITDEILADMERKGVPRKLIEKMKVGIGIGFPSEAAFIDYLKTIINKNEIRKYETLILENAATTVITPPVFKITEEVLDELKKKGVPANIIAKLKKMIDEEFESVDAFIQYLDTILEKYKATEYESLILENTIIHSITPAAFVITDEILERLAAQGIPSDIIAQLTQISGKRFSSPEDFILYLESIIGQEQTFQYKTQILEEAAIPPTTGERHGLCV